MLGGLIGGVVSGIGITLGKTIFSKLSSNPSNKESSITPAIPTVVEKDDRYQKLLQQYVIQQEKREAELKELVFASTKMKGQEILQEEKWRELTYRQQQELIDNAAKKDNRILELKEQELQQIQELEHLKLTLMEQWHQEKFSLQNRQILQEWDLSNWNSKLNREETEDLLQPTTFQNRLLVLVSRPKITGNPLFSDEVLHEQIKNSIFDLNEYIPRSELEVYCDYFKNPIEDTDIPRLKKILNSISTLIISTHIIRNRVHVNCVFWNMGDDETRIKIPSWDLSEILKSSSGQDDAILEVEEMITVIHKLLIIYTKDLYSLSLNLFYQPIFLSSHFQDVFQEDTSNLCSSLAEYIEKVKFEQKEKLDAIILLLKMELCEKILSGVDLSEADLSGVDLSNADLSGVDLSGVDLSNANLYGTNLSFADLRATDLSNANLNNANLSEAELCDAILRGTNLRGTNLSEADLSEADLTEADLSEADLSNANLSGVKLRATNLSKADLSGIDLSNENLSNANLSGVKLRATNLSKADLSGIDLSEADLSNANLSKADLRRADLRGADLSEADLSEADLRRVDLRGTGLNKANLNKANLQGTKFTRGDLSSHAKQITF